MADDRDNDKQGSERWGVQIPWLKDRERRRQEPPAEEPRVEEEFAEPGRAAPLEDEPVGDETEPDGRDEAGEIPSTRLGRSAKLGAAIGGQATRYAGTAAANLARSEERAQERTELRHVEAALKMVSVLGEMKGAAMKIGQMASFIDIDFLPPEYREIYQEQLAKLRAHAPAMPWEKVREVLVEEYDGRAPEKVFASIEEEAFAAASIGQVHRATLHDGSAVAVKIQYPGVAEALESDLANAGILVRVARALAPGLDAKASRASCASACWRSSTTSTRPRTSAPSPAPTRATPSSTSPRCTPASRDAGSWSASTSRAATSRR